MYTTRSGHEVIIIRHGEGGEMRATPDRLFLLSDGQLKTASLLGTSDELVSHSGSPVTIRSVTPGRHSGSMHHIGLNDVSTESGFNVNGHLVSEDR